MTSNIRLLTLAALVSLVACTKSADTKEDKAEKHESEANVVDFDTDKQKTIGMQTEEVREEAFGTVIHTTARVMPVKGDECVVTAKASGVARLSAAAQAEGVDVAAGTTLATIATDGIVDQDLKVRLASLKAQYESARKEYERKRALLAEKIVSESDYNECEARYKALETEYDGLRASAAGGSQTVSAPQAGYIKQILVSNGQYVEAGAPLFVITSNRQLTICADVQPSLYSKLAELKSVSFRQVSTGKVYGLEELGGSVLSYSKAVSDESPMLTVTFKVNNVGDLIPGGFLDTYMRTESRALSLTVPCDAVVEEFGSYFVYVRKSDDHFEKRLVSLGDSDGRRVAVADGLKKGETVVSKGAAIIKLSQSTGTVDAHAGHSH